MRSTLERRLNMCFTKIKFPGTTTKKLPAAAATDYSPPFSPADDHSRPLPHPTTTTASSSFPPEDLSRPLPNPTTTATTTTNLVKNFNSLYDDDDLTFDEYSTSHSKSLSSSSSLSSPSSSVAAATPDLAAAFASRRFFFSSPGFSNSIFESCSPSSSSSLSTTSDRSSDSKIVGGGVAVATYSKDPFEDFRRSMQEMVESRRLVDVSADWDHLHELLTCYLSLNPKSSHKFIVRAFSDLLVSMMASPPPPVKNGGKRRLL